MKEKKSETRKLTFWTIFSIIVIGVLIVFFLKNFNEKIISMEEERNEKTLESLADQASLVAEARLLSSINVLKMVAGTVDIDSNIFTEEMARFLSKVAADNEMDRIGLTDVEGKVINSNGQVLNGSEQNYFKVSMKGEVYISTVFRSNTVSEKSIVVSVPVYNEEEVVQGVIYGVIVTEEFNVYADMELGEASKSFVHIIDNQGNYIVRSESKDRLPGGESNYFSLLKKLGVDTEEIVNLISQKKTAIRHVEKDGEVRILFFAPMKVNNWCAVTVLTGEAANYNMDYSRRIVIELLIKILLAIGALAMIGYYVVAKEKIYIKRLNRELLVKDKVFQIGITGTGGYVFTYNRNTKKLEFLNQTKQTEKLFPKIVENFPDSIDTFPKQVSEVYRQLQSLLELLKDPAKAVEGDVSLDLEGRIFYYHVKITNIPGESQGEYFAVGTMADVTEERQNEVFLRSQIGKDPLTKTMNRAAAVEKINEILGKKEFESCAFYMMDLDNFKAVNDVLGHTTGDEVLIRVAEVISRHVRPNDIVCRLGGDEFVVFLVDIPESAVVRNVESLIKKLNLTFEKDGKQVTISVSVGIALAPLNGNEFQTLYEKADRTLYQVKNSGKNGYAVYEGELS